MKSIWNIIWIAALSAASAQAAPEVAIFEGVPGGIGRVAIYDDSAGALIDVPVELQQIEWLPIDFTGRTELEEFLPTRPRLRQDVPGASRLSLPLDQGSLYRYQRVVANDARRFGFMHVARDGQARSVLELDGTGPQSQVDPYVGRIAVARTGDAFLAATTVEAGGNLLEVRMTGAPVVIDRSADQPPRVFSDAGLLLNPTFGVGVVGRGILRFDRATNAPASFVPFQDSPVPQRFTGQLVSSRNGQWAAATAGPSLDQLNLYAFGANDSARRCTPAASALSGAGFEPEASDGPYLAIADDGMMSAWRTEGVSRECYVGRAQQAGAGAIAMQLSSDALFLDTLDEVGAMVFLTPTKFKMAVGEQPFIGANAIEKVDFFDVTLAPDASPTTFVNLSLSSGDATVPFDAFPPTIQPGRMHLLPDSSGMVVFDDDSERVLLIKNGQSGAQNLFTSVKTLDFVEVAGQHMLFSMRREFGDKPRELQRWNWLQSGTPALIVSVPHETIFERATPRRDGWVAFVVNDGGLEWLERVQLATGQVQEFDASPAHYGPALGWTAQDALALSRSSLAAGSAQVFATWPLAGGNVALQSASSNGHVLPGS